MIPQLEKLVLNGNSLMGIIPSEISQLSDTLKAFGVSDNSLTGSVPFEHFLQLSDTLEFLTIGGNKFDTWSIPTEIGYFSKLTNLGLSSSWLTGTIPDEIGNCSLMKILLLSNLGGTIPTILGSMTDLEQLFLGETNLSGSIPNELGNCTLMSTLDFSLNPKVRGTIPTSLGRMTNLQNLWLDTTQLSGTVPSEFVSLTRLTTFDIFFSDITGSINSIFCGGDPITGEVDEDTCNEKRLEWESLSSDCFGDQPEVECCCCTSCN